MFSKQVLHLIVMLVSNSALSFGYKCINLVVLSTYISAHPSMYGKDVNLFVGYCQIYITSLLPIRDCTLRVIIGACGFNVSE